MTLGKTARRITLVSIALGAALTNRYTTPKETVAPYEDAEHALAPATPEKPKTQSGYNKDAAEEVLDKYRIPANAKTYIAKHLPYALAAERSCGVPAAAALVKAGSEHSWGTNGDIVKPPVNNHFGIKFHDQYKAKYPNWAWGNTWERINGRIVQTRAKFTAYPNAQASYQHFCEYLRTRTLGSGPIYSEVFKHTETPEAFLTALRDTKYSTDLNLPVLFKTLKDYHVSEIVAAAKRP
jgi:flagellum-specific peptidoglycan hydrolase FlgJ